MQKVLMVSPSGQVKSRRGVGLTFKGCGTSHVITGWEKKGKTHAWNFLVMLFFFSKKSNESFSEVTC